MVLKEVTFKRVQPLKGVQPLKRVALECPSRERPSIDSAPPRERSSSKCSPRRPKKAEIQCATEESQGTGRPSVQGQRPRKAEVHVHRSSLRAPSPSPRRPGGRQRRMYPPSCVPPILQTHLRLAKGGCCTCAPQVTQPQRDHVPLH